MVRLLVLAVAWVLWSGRYTFEEPLIAWFGLLSCLAVALLSWRMDGQIPRGVSGTLTPRVVLYIPWLLLEIVKANLAVARIVLHPKLPISPRIFKVPATQRGEGARVLYANSITLTPGTVSLEVRDDRIWVHALTREMAEDVKSGGMAERVSRLERRR